jgi:hypothetical protein
MALSQPAHSTSHSHLPQISVDRLDSLQTATPSLKDRTVVQSSPALADAPSSGPILNDISNRQINNFKHRQSSPSTSSLKQNRSALFSFAALARDKTSNAIASLAEPSIRPRPSSGSLYRSTQSSPTSPSNHSNSLPRSADSQTSLDYTSTHNSISTSPSLQHTKSNTPSSVTPRQSLLETDPPSQAYSNTATDTPAPIVLRAPGNYNKMHQTSSRLLRMTSDDRPFTRVGYLWRRDLCAYLANI